MLRPEWSRAENWRSMKKNEEGTVGYSIKHYENKASSTMKTKHHES